MIPENKPSYEELENRLARAEEMLRALREGKVDAVLGQDSLYFLRLKEIELTLRESQKQFTVMADESPIIIWVTDAMGNLEFVNQAYRDYFGVCSDDVLRTDWETLVHPEDRKSYFDAFYKALDIQTSFSARTRVKRADGQWRWIESYGSPRFTAAGEFLGMVGSSPDITENKAIEDELSNENEKLLKGVRESKAELELRAEQLTRLASNLTLAEQRERRRIAELLHDHLQQLMVGAKLRQELLLESIDDALKPEAEKVLKLIEESIHVTASLNKELSPSAVRSGDLAASLKWLAQWFHETHGLEVQVNSEEGCVLKRKEIIVLLFQSVRELLLNVVKHADVGSAEIVISKDDSTLRISVNDDGCGFDPEVISDKVMKGGGFGLFSIRERLLLMGGSFDIKAVPGKGASFSLVVPLDITKAPPETESSYEI